MLSSVPSRLLLQWSQPLPRPRLETSALAHLWRPPTRLRATLMTSTAEAKSRLRLSVELLLEPMSLVIPPMKPDFILADQIQTMAPILLPLDAVIHAETPKEAQHLPGCAHSLQRR